MGKDEPKKRDQTRIQVSGIPEGHVILGYVAQLKVMNSDDGSMYWAMRTSETNDMEAYGMALDMVDSIRGDLQASKEQSG